MNKDNCQKKIVSETKWLSFIVHELFKYFISPDEFIENSTKKMVHASNI